MDLTPAQQRVVDHPAEPVRLQGEAGTGKTTALLHRYLRSVRDAGASRVLVICRSRDAATRFRNAALAHLSGGFDALPITTFHGLAFDVVHRGTGGDVRLLGAGEQWALVRDVLADDARGGDRELRRRWPTLYPLVGRRAFPDELADAVLAYEASLLGPDEVRARAGDAGVAERWHELAAFAGRYRAAMRERGALDAAMLVATACALLGDEGGGAGERARFAHVLVDDFETATVATNRLLSLLADPGASVTVAGNASAAVGAGAGASAVHLERFDRAFAATLDIELDEPLRHVPPAPRVDCRHPSIEPEAIAGELLAARAGGIPWSEMAVLVRRPRERARAITRALSRHGIPTATVAGTPADEPAVRGIVDLFRWVAGERAALDRVLASPLSGLDATEIRRVRREARAAGTELAAHPRLAGLVALADDLRDRAPAHGPADLAHEVFRRCLAHLVPDPDRSGPIDPTDERALDAVVAFLDGLAAHAERDPSARLPEYLAMLEGPEREPDLWRPAGPPTADAVTVTSIGTAAGREWHTVVLAGCVEGELPRVSGHVRFFDRAMLDGSGIPSVAERRRRSLAEERRLFGIATTRATGRLVAIAAPEPGVLTSRFVAGWPAREPTLPLAPGRSLPARPPTAGGAPVWPGGVLHLSASQLDTYADCPLRYAYLYALRVKGDAGVQADLGTLVHDVLATFLAPGGGEVTRERLMGIAAERWRDDIARFRPQVEEARRDYYEMLERWWTHEGGSPAAPEVLAVEHRFEIEVGPHHVRGSIDRVDRADDGTGIRIVDYKTGRAEPRADELADNLQLAVYHLAATRDPALAALGAPTQLRLLYLRSMHQLEQPVTADHAESTTRRVLDAAGSILAERFDPSVDAECRYCDFRRLCPLWPEGREVGDG